MTTLLPLRAAAIHLPDAAPSTIAQTAATELRRFLLILTGHDSGITHAAPDAAPRRAPRITLTIDPALARSLQAEVTRASVGDEGFRLRVAPASVATKDGSTQADVVIAALQPVGLLYGVYALLELAGMGFYAGGDTFPDRDDPAGGCVPPGHDHTHKPAFAARGDMLHYNFIVGPTTWGLDDYRFYFEQLAKQRGNVLLMHWYDGEPGAASEVDGRYVAGGPAENSLSLHWGATASLRTADFRFGAGDLFDNDFFGSRPAEDAIDTVDEFRRSEEMFDAATRHARALGVRVAAGFEAPRGSPNDPVVQSHFRTRLRHFLARNPALAHLALWQHESGGIVGQTPPAAGTPDAALMEQQRRRFEHLGDPMRIWEAIRFGRFAQIAHEEMKSLRPDLTLVIIGWGGDRWMRFADLCLGYDKTLPADVIFCCHENIDATFGPNVSTPWGQLPPARQRWAMPWVEHDLNDCWTRQPNVPALGKLAPDALKKGCQGLLTLHWRTRDVEEESGYALRFAWDPALTPRRFLRDLASDSFGPSHREPLGDILEQLQNLGARWTGVAGAIECGTMHWTGWNPPIPFRLDAPGLLRLRDLAIRGRDALAEVPKPAAAPGQGAFHERTEGAEAPRPRDMSRPGVAEFDAAAKRIESLTNQRDEGVIRAAIAALIDTLFDLRTKLIVGAMPHSCYRPVDEFLIQAHHLARHGDVEPHFAALAKIRPRLVALREALASAGHVRRLERLDFLLATMDFIVSYDRAAMLLASGGPIDQALASAAAAHARGDKAEAGRLAAQALGTLTDAGMASAVRSMTRRLTVRSDWGTLATILIKPIPLYFETLTKLNKVLSAPPTTSLRARGGVDAVAIEWPKPTVSAGAGGAIKGYRLDRRRVGESVWRPLIELAVGALPMEIYVDRFAEVDRSAEPGDYEYAVASIAADGVVGPRSQSAFAAVGNAAAVRLLACKPPGFLPAGEDFLVRVVAAGDLPVDRLTLKHRLAGETIWKEQPMLHRFRRSFQALLPVAAVPARGVMQWHVEAKGRDGRIFTWPETTGDGLPWSVAIHADCQ
ncbi:MAG: hypothetical protein NTW19_09050 [Planctomycetota bacterium]|nr:hypothetical protein [Planctomycetota bacterium]